MATAHLRFQYFEDAEKLDASYGPLQTRLGELYVGRGEVDRAKEKFLTAGTDHAIVGLAQIAAREEKWSEVIEILDSTSIPAAQSLVRIAKSKLNNEPHEPFSC